VISGPPFSILRCRPRVQKYQADGYICIDIPAVACALYRAGSVLVLYLDTSPPGTPGPLMRFHYWSMATGGNHRPRLARFGCQNRLARAGVCG